ncbi:MAG: cobalt ECF transporter T component CbiQ, partial [Magnetococcales bacterium]|nr:cobalt ECF transporter T component CbiQ [Magnetococcales bacterium]
MRILDQVAHDNAWSRRGSGGKVALCLGLLAVALGGPAPSSALLVLLAVVLLACVAARIPIKLFLGLLAVPGGFLAAGLPALALSIDWRAGIDLTWSEAGAHTALLLGLRSLAALSAMLLLALTTPPLRLLEPARRLGVPPVLLDLALLTYRLTFLLSEVALAAMRSQSFRLGYWGWRRSLRSLALLVAGLLGRTLERAKRLETGLTARGYTGEFPVLVA